MQKYFISLAEIANTKVSPVKPIDPKPKNAFNWEKKDVVEYVRSLGFPKEAAMFAEQVLCMIVEIIINVIHATRYRMRQMIIKANLLNTVS